MISDQSKIDFLSAEIDRLNDLIDRLTPHAEEVVDGKPSNQSILEDAINKRQVYQGLLSDL